MGMENEPPSGYSTLKPCYASTWRRPPRLTSCTYPISRLRINSQA